MKDKQETVADIVAEMREHGAAISGLLIPDDGGPTRAMTPDLADRLEAAHKRERVGKSDRLGDAAKMREAVGNALWCLNWMGDHTSNESITDHLAKPIELLTAALSAPARNCDKFATADAAWDAWMHGPGCRREGEGFVGLLDWLYAKEEEEGGAE